MTKKDGEMNTQLILGILGFLGVIITSVLTIYAPVIQEAFKQKNPPTDSPANVLVVTATFPPTAVPTDTVPPGDPTSTPAPATDTPVPTFTFTAAPPALAAGEDWLQNCISTAWKVYPGSQAVSDNNGCYVKFLDGFSIRDQRLTLTITSKSVPTEETVGMFVEIPSNAVIDLNVHLRNIDAGEIRTGIFQEPDIRSQGVMAVVPAGNPKNSAFAVHSMPADIREYISGKFKKDNGDYLITFDVASGNVIVRFEKYTSVKPIDVQADANGKKWLFIGYKAIVGKNNTMDANFFGLTITPR